VNRVAGFLWRFATMIAVLVALATVAGIGYGWIDASTRSIVGAIAAHTGVNAVHYFFFTYP